MSAHTPTSPTQPTQPTPPTQPTQPTQALRKGGSGKMMIALLRFFPKEYLLRFRRTTHYFDDDVYGEPVPYVGADYAGQSYAAPSTADRPTVFLGKYSNPTREPRCSTQVCEISAGPVPAGSQLVGYQG